MVIASEALHRMPACGRQGVQGEAKQSRITLPNLQREYLPPLIIIELISLRSLPYSIIE